jgi:hypothetical protein
LALERSIAGPLAIDSGYLLTLADSIVDAGSGSTATLPALALGAATGNADLAWGPDLVVRGLTAFGRVRVQTARGEGGLFVHRLEVHDNQDSHTVDVSVGQRGSCLKFCWFSGDHDRLPQHFGCVFGQRGTAALQCRVLWSPRLCAATTRLRPPHPRRRPGQR